MREEAGWKVGPISEGLVPGPRSLDFIPLAYDSLWKLWDSSKRAAKVSPSPQSTEVRSRRKVYSCNPVRDSHKAHSRHRTWHSEPDKNSVNGEAPPQVHMHREVRWAMRISCLPLNLEISIPICIKMGMLGWAV